MLWASLTLNVATILISLRKRMILYALLQAIFLFLVVGQGFQIAADLDQRHAVQYLNNYITDIGFELAKIYVLGCCLFSFALSVASRNFVAEEVALSGFRFRPPAAFYLALMIVLILISGVLIFGVVGLQTFLHSSRPGYQSGATIFIVLLIIGIFPLLLKILSGVKTGRSDITCAVVSSVVTAGFSRIHIFLYLTVLLLSLFYASGWYKKSYSASMMLRLCAIGLVGFAVFFGIGSLHDAQNYVNGSLSDLVKYLTAHPERSLLSIQYNYRVGIEGMSGIAGACTQSLNIPDSVRPDYGVSVIMRSAILASPGVVKSQLSELEDLGNNLNWYPSSIVPTGSETFLVSFGWPAIALYPLAVYFLGWFLPRLTLKAVASPFAQLGSYVLFACLIFFARGSLPTWISFSVSYVVVILFCWPFFRPHLQPDDGSKL